MYVGHRSIKPKHAESKTWTSYRRGGTGSMNDRAPARGAGQGTEGRGGGAGWGGGGAERSAMGPTSCFRFAGSCKQLPWSIFRKRDQRKPYVNRIGNNDEQFMNGTMVALRFWLLNKRPSLLCPWKPFSCKA